MGSRSESKAARLRVWLDEHHPQEVGEREIEQIRNLLGPVSTGYLRRLLRASGTRLDPLIEGVVQDNLADLERTLLALQSEYEASDAQRRSRIREVVIEAKQHCRWAVRRLEAEPERSEEKREALLWMNTWLENPPVFSMWLTVRRRE